MRCVFFKRTPPNKLTVPVVLAWMEITYTPLKATKLEKGNQPANLNLWQTNKLRKKTPFFVKQKMDNYILQ